MLSLVESITPSVVTPGREVPAFLYPPEALPDVADTITIHWAVSGQYNNLVAQFGAGLMDRLVQRTEDDVRATIGQRDEGRRQAMVDEYYPGVTPANFTGHRSDEVKDLEVNSVDDMLLVWCYALTQDQEVALDWLLVPEHRRERAAIPLYWFLPVRRAIELQAQSGATEDDRVRAAELAGRIFPSEHVQHIAAALAGQATEQVALVQ